MNASHLLDIAARTDFFVLHKRGGITFPPVICPALSRVFSTGIEKVIPGMNYDPLLYIYHRGKTTVLLPRIKFEKTGDAALSMLKKDPMMVAAYRKKFLAKCDGFVRYMQSMDKGLRKAADEDLLKNIAEALNESGMKAELLEMELTENMVMQNAERAGKLLAALKQLGVRLAIDDFGVGYSSLAILKRFPIDTLKVDRSFIRDIPQDSEDKAITRAIIAMGKILNLTVVAEGVETLEQETFLREHGCDETQGYYFSKPVASDQFAALLRRHIEATK